MYWQKKLFILIVQFCIHNSVPFLIKPGRHGLIFIRNADFRCYMTLDSNPPPSESSSNLPRSDPVQDLTDRFKYKVNALMGTYDPVQAVSDNERNSGNILNAMIQFPTDYCFNVLGKTQGDDSMKQKYIQDVTSIVEKVSGYGSEHFDIRVIDRGIRFTKISITVKVDSTSVINSIYDELGRIDMTVMKY